MALITIDISNGPTQDNPVIPLAVWDDSGNNIQAFVPTDKNGNELGVSGSPLEVAGTVAVTGAGETIAAGTPTRAKVAAGALTASYATLVNPGAGTRRVYVRNHTDGDLLISFDASTDHVELSPGKEFEEDYGSNFFDLTVTISVKQGTKTPTAGTVYGLAYSV